MSAGCDAIDGAVIGNMTNPGSDTRLNPSPLSSSLPLSASLLPSPLPMTGIGAANSSMSAATPPRFVDNDDYGPQINFTLWFLAALSSLFLALRLYCKAWRHRGLWWDDHVLTAAWVSLVLQCAFVSVCITLGFGRPLDDFNPDNLEPLLIFSNLAGTSSILGALWSKTSFAITVLRISNGWTKRLIWFIMISVNIALGLSIAFTWGGCTPIQKTWKPETPGTCWPKFYLIRYNIFTAAYSGAMDIVLAVIPWRIIWPMTMNKKEKFGVLLAMSMGVFAGVTSMIKISTLPGIGNSSFTDSTTQLVILAAAETAITIMAASIPILRALLLDVGPTRPGPASFYRNPGPNDPYSLSTMTTTTTTTTSTMHFFRGSRPPTIPASVLRSAAGTPIPSGAGPGEAPAGRQRSAFGTLFSRSQGPWPGKDVVDENGYNHDLDLDTLKSDQLDLDDPSRSGRGGESRWFGSKV
ncbi:hypothetical protein VTK73DRAFT_839 [Phialemonium thermophilum]|uniref:Rhodopsin domain-containing protein n=1 Tax=Phialemonium thermophilum TaxID=223376 RepID=A0ABR3XD36_9PEZI